MKLSTMKNMLLLLPMIFICHYGISATYYVSSDGNDTAPGSEGAPFQSIEKAISLVVPGDTIFVRESVYALTNTIAISKSGNSENYISLMAYPGERPILNFSSQPLGGSARGILLKGSYWHMEGLDITGAGDNGLKIDGGNYNRIVNCAFYRNRDSGVQLGNGASGNSVINCDSYFNADPTDYGDADGFAAKLDVGSDNYFYGCRAWRNCDDGWDGYLRGADNVSTVIENCWAFENGYFEDGTDAGVSANGNGFKMGGSDDKTLRHDTRLVNCLAFGNKAKGFDQNNNKGTMILYNCTGYDNLVANYRIKLELYAGEELIIKNCVALGGKAEIGDFAVQEANSWLVPFVVAPEDFISVDNTSATWPRQPDGSLPEIPFMHLAEGSDLIDAGVDVGMAYSGQAPDLGCFEVIVAGLNSEKFQRHSILIYPNPASDVAWIETEQRIKGLTSIALIDLTGREVRSMEFADGIGAGTCRLDLSGIRSGFYLLNIRSGTMMVSKPLVVE